MIENCFTGRNREIRCFSEPIQYTEKTQNIDEGLVKLGSAAGIDFSPVDWSVCNDEHSLRFAVALYYLQVMKNGIIPPKYITGEE